MADTDLAKLVVRLEAQTEQFSKQMKASEKNLDALKRNVDRNTRAMQTRFSQFGSGLKRAFLALGVGLVFRQVIKETAEAEKNLALLENAVRANAGAAGLTTPELTKMAEEIAHVTAFTDDAVMQMQALLLRFRQIGDPATFKRAQSAILDIATAMGTDLPAAAAAVGRALADPERGLRGLTSLGVIFTKQEREKIKALFASGQAMEAQAIILGKLEDKAKGAAEAYAHTFGGALQGLSNDFHDLMEAKDGLPAATQSLVELRAVLQDPGVKQGADTLFSAMIVGAAKAVEFIGKLIAGLNVLSGTTGNKVEDLSFDIDHLTHEIEKAEGAFGSLFVRPDQIAAMKAQRQVLIDLRTEYENTNAFSDEALARYNKLAGGANDLTAAMDPLPEKVKEATASLADLVDKARLEVETFGLGAVETARLEIAHRRLKGEFKETGAAADALTADYLEALEAAEELAQGEKNLQVAIDARAADVARATELTEQSLTPHEKFLEIMTELNRLHETAGEGGGPLLGDEAFYRNVAAATEALNEQLNKNAEALNVFQEEASRATQRVIADFLLDWHGGLKGFLASWGEALRQMAAQAVAARLSSYLFGSGVGSGGGAFGQLAGALVGMFGGGGGTAAATVGGAYNPGVGGVGPYIPRDSGGRGYPGSTYAISPSVGTEYFVPDRAGTFVTEGKLSGAPTQHFHFAGDRAPSRQTLMQVSAAAARGAAEADRRNN